MRPVSWSAVLILELVLRFHRCSTFSVLSMKSESLVTGPTPKRTRLFTARYPLEGGPKQLKLHMAVIIEDLSQASAHTASLPEETPGRCYVLFDFLPRKPTSISTAVRLLTGGEVPGNLRERELRYLPPGAEFVGCSDATVEDMRAFTKQYPNRLSLFTNSCYSFCRAFITRHRSNIPPTEDQGG